MNGCKFCNKFNSINSSLFHASEDTILLESKNFIVTPTLGSLVEGWVLIVSKEHFISVGQLNKTLVRELEHGPCAPKQTVGCGIDHLHVHVVPLKFNLFEKAKEQASFKWEKVASIVSNADYFESQLPYLFIETPTQEKYITTDANIPSQFFRKIIASELKIADLYDWKLNFGIENIEKTLSVFSSELQPT
jgi:ATP adenylyltransferase